MLLHDRLRVIVVSPLKSVKITQLIKDHEIHVQQVVCQTPRIAGLLFLFQRIDQLDGEQEQGCLELVQTRHACQPG